MALTDVNNSYPAIGVIVVTPSDTVDLVKPARAIRATAAGAITITTIDGNKVACNFAAGETRPIGATRIWATGTAATGIEALY